MTYSPSYPQVFLDANTLVRVALSISHHLRDPKGRKSALRLFMERGVITFSTGALQLARTIELILEGDIDTHSLRLSEEERISVVIELLEATAGARPLIVLISLGDTEKLDSCRHQLYSELSEKWESIVDWDEEDRRMIREASLAYARYGLVRTSREIYRPRAMILASDDRRVQRGAEGFDISLKDAILSFPHCIKPVQGQLSKQLIYVIGYEKLKQLVQQYTI